MENILYINYDSERERIVELGKNDGFVQPTTQEENKVQLYDDLESVFQTLVYLIDVIEASGNGEKKKLLTTCVNKLNTLIEEKPQE